MTGGSGCTGGRAHGSRVAASVAEGRPQWPCAPPAGGRHAAHPARVGRALSACHTPAGKAAACPAPRPAPRPCPQWGRSRMTGERREGARAAGRSLLTDFVTLERLGSAGRAARVVGEAQRHYVERVVPLRNRQLAGELLGLLRIQARLLEVSQGGVLAAGHRARGPSRFLPSLGAGWSGADPGFESRLPT